MTVQENVGVLVTFAEESAFGTPPSGSGTSYRLRRTTSSLTLQKDTFQSNEVRPDQQVSSFRHGGHRVAGAIEGELSTESYDILLAALMRQDDWTAGVALDESDFTSLAVSSGVITLASGNPSTLGLRIGDIVDFTNMSEAANNTRARIIAMTATTFTTYPALADQSADSECDVAVVGEKLIFGTEKRSFTFEHSYPGIDVARRFDGCRIGGASFRVPPNDKVMVSFDVMGQKGVVLDAGSAPYFTNATAAPNTEVLTGIEGGLRMAGAEQAIVTGFDLQVSHNLTTAPVVGSPYVPDIFYGRIVVTGNVSFYLADKELIEAFINEEEHDLVLVCEDATGDEFISFNMQRVKFGGASDAPTGDGGVIVTAPFQALLKSAGVGYDATTLTIQRSNA